MTTKTIPAAKKKKAAKPRLRKKLLKGTHITFLELADKIRAFRSGMAGQHLCNAVAAILFACYSRDELRKAAKALGIAGASTKWNLAWKVASHAWDVSILPKEDPARVTASKVTLSVGITYFG